MKHRPEIDGLRAIAVMVVILFHLGLPSFSGGYIGVDIFFVISGYLITKIIVEEIDEGVFSIAGFYERRARRILPALFTVCLSTIPFAWLWMSPQEFKYFSQSLIAVAGFSSNVLFWQQAGYFAPTVELIPLLHTWSLAVEEQFYLFFPPLLLTIWRLGRAKVLCAIGLLTIASFSLAVYAASIYPDANFYLIPTRAWELGVGSLIAFKPTCAQKKSVYSQLAAMAGAGLITYSVVCFDKNTPHPSYFTLLPIAGTVLLLIWGGKGDLVGRFLSMPPVMGLGLMSYSLYLWHQPILAFVRIRSLYAPSIGTIILGIILTCLFSLLTWKFVELPFRDRKRWARQSVLGILGFMGTLIAAIGLAGHLTNGFANATPLRAHTVALDKDFGHNYGLDTACNKVLNLGQECRTDDAPEIAIWGDSYAMHLVDALIASNPKIKLIQLTKSVCGPVLGVAPLTNKYPEQWSKGCLEFNKKAVDWMTANKGLKYVVLSSTFLQYAEESRALYAGDGTINAHWESSAKRFISTLDLLKRTGIEPVVISPPPRFGGNIGHCLFRTKVLGLPGNACDFDRTDYEHSAHATILLLKEIEKHNRVIWLHDVLCDLESCRATLNGVDLYRDTGHLTRKGSAEIGKRLNLYSRLTSTASVD